MTLIFGVAAAYKVERLEKRTVNGMVSGCTEWAVGAGAGWSKGGNGARELAQAGCAMVIAAAVSR